MLRTIFRIRSLRDALRPTTWSVLMPRLAVFPQCHTRAGSHRSAGARTDQTDHRFWLNRAMGVTGIEPVTSRV
jgi:hypothetical protein